MLAVSSWIGPIAISRASFKFSALTTIKAISSKAVLLSNAEMKRLPFKPMFLNTKALIDAIKIALAIQIKGINASKDGVKLPSRLPLNTAAIEGRNMAGSNWAFLKFKAI